MSSLLIKGGIVVAGGTAKKGDILVKDGLIVSVGGTVKESADKVIDASGLYVLPGLIDMHTHMREPGLEYKEDIDTGAMSAAAGGFTTVACMPNTKPVLDIPALIKYIKYRSAEAGRADVVPIGAITKGQKGAELAELRLMHDAGAVAFSDDGVPVDSALMMRNALEYAKDFDGLLISHCEDRSLSDGGSVNEGYHATVAGLKGIPAAAEEVMAARDIILAGGLGARVHIAHVSTKGTAQIIRLAKAQGIRVTAETCPQYLVATDELIADYNTFAKINPPLRTEGDRLALIEAVKDGTIDVLVTDHAPHHIDDKKVEFGCAAFGSVGLESAVGLYVSRLIGGGVIDWVKFADMASTVPAEILRLKNKGVLKAGYDADITIIDPDAEYTFDTAKTFSKSRNSAFEGWKLKGRAVRTILKGREIFSYYDEVSK